METIKTKRILVAADKSARQPFQQISDDELRQLILAGFRVTSPARQLRVLGN